MMVGRRRSIIDADQHPYSTPSRMPVCGPPAVKYWYFWDLVLLASLVAQHEWLGFGQAVPVNVFATPWAIINEPRINCVRRSRRWQDVEVVPWLWMQVPELCSLLSACGCANPLHVVCMLYLRHLWDCCVGPGMCVWGLWMCSSVCASLSLALSLSRALELSLSISFSIRRWRAQQIQRKACHTVVEPTLAWPIGCAKPPRRHKWCAGGPSIQSHRRGWLMQWCHVSNIRNISYASFLVAPIFQFHCLNMFEFLGRNPIPWPAQGLEHLQDAKFATGSGGVGFILYSICLGPLALVFCILALPFMAPRMWYGTLGLLCHGANWIPQQHPTTLGKGNS